MNFDFQFNSRRSNVIAQDGMVASSQPLATLAGLDVLRAGGNAADAAIAVAAALCVVEPFSTGIGGDCFALYWDAREHQVYALNSSGPAAQAASLDELLDAGYQHYPLFTGQAVTVPGSVAGWEALVERYGKMSLADVLKPAIRYAQEGYPVSELIATSWSKMAPKLTRQNLPDQQQIPLHLRMPGPTQPSGEEFLINGRPPRVGELIQLKTLANTLQGIAAEGSAYIYHSEFSKKLCDHVQRYQGWLQPQDLQAFRPQWVTPLFADYRGYRLYECPPNGQGLAAIIAAKLAAGFDLASMHDLDRTHILIECMRIGFAEGLAWIGDPAFTSIPIDLLLSEDYIQARRNEIKMERANPKLSTRAMPTGDDTVYFSVVDGEGNACSFINSLYYGGGTGLVVPGTGVLLQNRGANFSLDPSHPNVIKSGKRPYHTIIPGMIAKEEELFASFGVMGGFMQPQGHLQTLVNMIDLELAPQQALDMPRFRLEVEGDGMGANQSGGVVHLEEGFSFADMADLARRGHKLVADDGYQRVFFGSGQIIVRDPVTGVLIGGSDPRKDGCAVGY